MSGLPNEESIMTLDSIHKYHTIHTNLRATYGTKWEPWEAFRELVQNWRDAIIRSFNLDEKNFKVIREEKSQDEILYKVPAWPRTLPVQYLGYIRFSGNEKGGRVELVNRKATIQPSHFDLGGTTKAKDRSQAGEHGDGLKVALLVLMRAPQNHSIGFNAGGFRWQPNFDKHDKLVINLSRLQAYDIAMEQRSIKPDFQEGLIPVLATPQDDVKFIIGLEESVKVQDFKGWTKAALFLQDIEDGGIVSVAEGGLLTSYHLRGNIYLKGLLLKASRSNAATGRESASITGKPLCYGYNFAHGNTNRDRQSLAGAHEEAKAISSIWAQVLQKEPDLINHLHGMLNTRSPEYADISQAEDFFGMDVINRLKNYLFSEPFEKRWYYARSEKDNDGHLDKTIAGLGKEPFPLEETYWDMLRSHGIVRTAEEENRTRFLSQEEEPIPDTSFSKGVDWYLRACLKSCIQTAQTRFICVEGSGLDAITLWEKDKNLVRIHKKWFLPDRAADELGLDNAADSPRPFFPTVKQLFYNIIQQIPDSSFPLFDGRPRRWYKATSANRVEQRLLDCVQLKKRLKLSITGPSHEPELLVSWSPDASWEPSKRSLLVEVHQVSKCTHFTDSLLAGSYLWALKTCIRMNAENMRAVFGPRPPHETCGSSLCDYGPGDGHVTFSGLQENEEYFAVMCNTAGPSTFVVVSENTVVVPPATARPPPPPPVVKKQTYTLGEEREHLDIMTPRKWYDASNAEGQEAVVGIPPEDALETSAEKTPGKRSAPQETPTVKRARAS